MKEEILKSVISNAVESGEMIRIHFSQYRGSDFRKVSKSEAFTLAQMVADATGGTVEEFNGDCPGVGSFIVDTENIRICSSYCELMEEDIDLTGSDFDDRQAI